MKEKEKHKERSRNIKLVITDVDGVLTKNFVTLFGKPGKDNKIFIELHAQGKTIRMPDDEAGDVHYLSTHDDDRIEGHQFFIGDGTAISECKRNDIPVIFITGRNARAVQQRAADLGVEYYYAGHDKAPLVEQLLRDKNLDWSDIVFIGNDVQDLSLLRRVGFSAAPADAVPEVIREVHYVSERNGGEGAVRDVLQLILEAKGKWPY